ncbi:peptidoglycan-binding protein [Streptomyces sp. NPDC059009]|uniref:peptidoglycan-binding domain-containing protein n=1 Tax=Streptomyces sp. NPDC059009 TaxID=3346694 RepID=UPI00369F7629
MHLRTSHHPARTRRAAIAASSLLTAAGLLLTGTASATAADGIAISGQGNPFDDWWNEGTLTTSAYNHSNVAAMWQTILWADGYLNWDDIDCSFGPKAKEQTIWWQRYHDLRGDGMVGPKTFKKATEDRLAELGGNKYRWVGKTGRHITFYRAANGKWGMYLGNDLKTLWYGKATFNKC